MGFSAKPVAYEYSVHDHADMHEALLAHLGVEVCHVLAHDLGDSVGQELLARHEFGELELPSGALRVHHLAQRRHVQRGLHPAPDAEADVANPVGRHHESAPGQPRVAARCWSRTIDEMFGPNTKPSPRMSSSSTRSWTSTTASAGDAQGRPLRRRPLRPPQPLGAGDAGDQRADAADRRARSTRTRGAHGRALPRGDPRRRRRDARRRHRALAADRGARRGAEALPRPRRPGQQR